ncbi:MAG: peptidylprolyl isomerase, partial [Thermoanaerobaculia bacterium]
PALRSALEDEDVSIASWSARAVGILADGESVPRLLELAKRAEPSCAIEALLALEKIGVKTKLPETARQLALTRVREAVPGIALSALKLLGRFPSDAECIAVLSRTAADTGRRGAIALVSLMTADPEHAAEALERALSTGALPLRLAAAEAVYLAPSDDRQPALVRALQRDISARVRALLVSGVPAERAQEFKEIIVRSLSDPDAAVRSSALEVAAPLLDAAAAEPHADLEKAWRDAYERAFREKESDFIVGALDAAATWKKGGRALIEARVDDPDAVVRGKARRLMVEKFETAADRFLPDPVATRLTKADYRRLARRANETLLVASVTTTRGTFELSLDTEEAPLTAENFRALAARRFFDGIVIHRVVPDFVAQAGDPRGDGSGGPGYSIRDEINPLRYTRGALGMALSGPDTGGSQWFVTLSPQPHLDGGYTVFGRVASGEPVLDLIEQDDVLRSVVIREAARPQPPPGATDR